MISTQESYDEILVKLKLLTIEKVVCIIVMELDYTDKF